MVFVDTSVWIAYFRGKNAALGEHLDLLLGQDEVALPVPVRVELLAGSSRNERRQLRELMLALPAYYPEVSTWARMEAWTELAVGAGQRFGLGDLLIAAIAADHQGELWSLDSDFAAMARLQFLTLHASP